MGRRARSGLVGVIAFAIYAIVFLVSSGILPMWAGGVLAAVVLLALAHPGLRARVRRDFGRYLRDARARAGRSRTPGVIEPTELPHPRVTGRPAPAARPTSSARTASSARRASSVPASSAPARPTRAPDETRPGGATPADSPSPELVARLTELRRNGRTVEAIEVLREVTGMELYEASRFVLSLAKR